MVENLIRKFREQRGLTQVELSRRAKMAPQNLSAIERGQLAPWPRVKKSLCRVLRCTESELFPMD